MYIGKTMSLYWIGPLMCSICVQRFWTVQIYVAQKVLKRRSSALYFESLVGAKLWRLYYPFPDLISITSLPATHCWGDNYTFLWLDLQLVQPDKWIRPPWHHAGGYGWELSNFHSRKRKIVFCLTRFRTKTELSIVNQTTLSEGSSRKTNFAGFKIWCYYATMLAAYLNNTSW